MSVALRIAPRSASRNDDDLIARVRRGDDRAFEELYTRYRRRVSSYILGMVGDHGRAEDITQEVFISALRRMRNTERPIAFKPWIYEIAKNACIDNSRRAGRGQEVSLDAGEGEVAATHLGAMGRMPSIETAVETKQRLDDLRGAFGCLSESHHQILVLRELEGLSYKQIGERMGMSRPVVESTLFRARRRLGEEYQELVSGRRCEHVQALVSDSQAKRHGLRERRSLARHLAHCQPCRRHALLAGFDASLLKRVPVANRIAALLPIPLVRLIGSVRGRGPRHGGVAASSALRSPAVARSVDTLTRLGDPAGGAIASGRAAAALAALALTGAGGGLLIGSSGPASSPLRQSAPANVQATGSPGAASPATPGASADGRLATGSGAGAASGSRQSKVLANTPGAAGSPTRDQAPGTSSPGAAASSFGPASSPTAPIASAPGHPVPGGGLPSLPGSGPLSVSQAPALPRVGVPNVGLPNGGLPNVGVPNVGVPRVGVPNVGVPRVGVPNAGVPRVGVPNVGVPRVGVPKVGVPNVGVPNVGVPNVGAPNVGAPNVGAPNVGLPKVGVPHVGAPNLGVPNVGAPNVGVPHEGAPNVGAPKVGVPNVGVPHVGAPNADVPNVGVPEAGAPHVGVP